MGKINVNINNLFSIAGDVGITIADLAHDYKKVTGNTIVGAKINNIIVDRDTKIFEDTRVDFFDYTTPEGNKIYQAGLKFVNILSTKAFILK